MTAYRPLPQAGARPIHETARVLLGPQEKGTVTLEPEAQGQTHYVPIIAISKRADATYSVTVDEVERFGPNAPAPPTDPDNLQTTFLAPIELSREMQITVRDVRTTGTEREFEIHVVGWEAV